MVNFALPGLELDDLVECQLDDSATCLAKQKYARPSPRLVFFSWNVNPYVSYGFVVSYMGSQRRL